jgi:glycosyltransferase involved in cell wall biosynthesis
MSLSVVIISKNEEKNILRCLKAVSFADERIVYDTGSSDRTCEIAEENGCRVVHGHFDGFGTTKQRALELATMTWVLSLDADEVVTDELAAELKKLKDSSDVSGFEINRRTEFLGRWMSHGGWFPDWIVRVAKRTEASFSDRLVHEGMLVRGKVGRLGGELLHYSYPSLECYLEKGNQYTSLGAVQIAKSRHVGSVHLVIHPGWQFVKQYVFKRGFLDGWQGFVLASLSAMQVMTKYSKARILQAAAKRMTHD